MTDLMTVLLVFIITLVASFAQAIGGFGYVIISMALLPLFLPVHQCLVISQVSGVLMSVWMLWGKFRKLDLRYIALPTVAASVSAVAGLWFLKAITDSVYLRLLGVVLILLALWMWKLSARFRIRATPLSAVLCGGFSGLLCSLFSVATPSLILYYSANMEEKDDYMVPLQATIGIQGLICILGRMGLGQWPEGSWGLVAVATLGGFLGKIPGSMIYDRMNVDLLKKVIYLFVGALGLYMLIK